VRNQDKGKAAQVLAKNKLIDRIPPLIGIHEFRPTQRMIEFVWTWAKLLEKCVNEQEIMAVTPYIVCKHLCGFAESTYYNWRKKPSFQMWLNAVLNDFHKTVHLQTVWSSILRRATANSPQDAKLWIERWDDGYKPTTTTEHKISGIRPPDAVSEAQAIGASRKRIESITKGNSEVIDGIDRQG